MSAGKENAKPSIREWTFPSSPNLNSQPAFTTNSTSSPSSRPVEVAHGRSSSTAPGLPSNNPKRGASALSSIQESSGSKADALRHRTNASVFAAQMGGGGQQGVSFPTSPQQAVKMVYSNVRRRSLHDLAYSILFVGSLLLFAYSVTGMGYDPSSSAVSKSSLAKKAQQPLAEVQIPDSFLPSRDEPPVDVHQPHGDSSHDTGDDLMQDSPNDPKLNDENLHRHVQDKEDALFAEGHEEAERELDQKLNRAVSAEDLEAFAEVAEEQDEDTVDISTDEPEEEDEDEDEESEPAPEEELTAEQLDADSAQLNAHSHAGGYRDPEERRLQAAAALKEAEHLREGAFGVGSHDHPEEDDESEVELDLSGAPVPDEEDDDEDDSVQDQDEEADEEGGATEGDEDEEDLAEPAALPVAARRRRGGKRQIRMLR